MKKILFIAFAFITTLTQAEVFDRVVGPHGDYETIDAALTFRYAPTERTLIFIENGTYNEKISITYDSICLIGESTDGVIITNGDYNGDDEGHGTTDSYTVSVSGDGFYAENITFVNSAGDNAGQAVALLTEADNIVLKNCKMYGFQDTYYAKTGKQYMEDCYIEGDVDFIFGDATAFFQNCTMNCVSDGGYVTAPADAHVSSTITVDSKDSTLVHGYLFNECEITAKDGLADNSFYLGRPWQPNSSSVYINCTLGDHIKPVGWDSMGTEGTWKTAFFAEYKSLDTDGNLVDTTNRVDWSHQLSDDDVTNYFNIEYFFTIDGETWDPTPITVALDAPTGLTGTGYTLSWTAIDTALGYAVVRNDSIIGFSETNSYTDESVDSSKTNVYSVKSVYTYGNLSTDASDSYTVDATTTAVEGTTAVEQQLFTIINNNQIISDEPINIKIISLDGKCLAQFSQTQSVELTNYSPGIYLVQANNNIVYFTQKIILR